MGFELAEVSWSWILAGTLRAQPLKFSAFVPFWSTYLNTDESIRGQGEARKILLRNVSAAGLGLKVHLPDRWAVRFPGRSELLPQHPAVRPEILHSYRR